jgi:hypothetical protein
MGSGTIQEWWLSCKGWGGQFIEDWGLFSLILVATLASFGLGRVSALIEAKPVVSVAQAASLKAPQTLVEGGLIEASRSGSVYYYPWCSGALKIAPSNQRWFASVAAAKAAGCTPAKNCKGLGEDAQ